MTDRYIVGDLVAEFLQRMDVSTVFGIVSVHNIPMLDAIGRRNAIRFVTARGEYGGGHMADAYARSSGELGVLVTSTGPGAANAVPALVEAQFAGTPMLHLTGQTATSDIDQQRGPVHDVPGQTAMLEAVSKAAFRVRSAETALGTLLKAVTLALTAPMGPVSVEIPIDIQRSALPRPETLDHLVRPVPTVVEPAGGSVAALADRLRSAKRPMLWVGNGAKFAEASIRRLMGLGIPVMTSWNGRGAVPEDDPMSLGATLQLPETQTVLGTVDLLIVAGCRLRGHETGDLSIPLPKPRVQIDVDPAANGRTYGCDLFVHGDAARTLTLLADTVGPLQIDPAFAGEIAAAKTAGRTTYLAKFGPYSEMADAVRAALPEHGRFVRDVTLAHSTWGHRAFDVHGPRENIYPVGAAIGPGLAMGIGAALGAGGQKTVCMSGDGGFAMNIAELWTAADERADVAFLVMNDQGFGVIKHIQDALYEGRHHFADPTPADFEALAKSTGMPYRRIDTIDYLQEALGTAIAHDGPAMVEVDMAKIGPYPRYYVPPPYAKG
jgi:acetolactate synthase-1/2/3 large subunit